ncbi:MAG: hypothetical protein ABL983_21195 [Nitrospira sp.]
MKHVRRNRALVVAVVLCTIGFAALVVTLREVLRALQGASSDLDTQGFAGTMRRIGFLPHDARIFEALTARGGVLVAIHSEPRAADALAVLHAFGGGNAAIGAWTGRL